MQKYVIYNCTEPPAGGLADRIKGLVSCYALAKLLDRQFIIDWTYPYRLQHTVNPGTINWLPRPIQGTCKQYFAIDQDNYYNFESLFNIDNAQDKFKEDITILRTNINFLYHLNQEHNFKSLFEDLFAKPALPFDTSCNTIGVCARFGGNLSNWPDSDFNRTLKFNDVLNKISQLHATYPDKQIFVCSDSSKFIDYIKTETNVLVTPGITEHMDRPGCSMQGFVKSFHDFFLLRQCDIIVSTKGGFAITAAISSGKKVTEI